MNELAINNNVVNEFGSSLNKAQALSGKEELKSEKTNDKVVEKRESIQPEESLETVTENLTNFVQSVEKNISFSIDKESGTNVISVIDKNTSEVLRQIPSEEALELVKNLDKIAGILFDTKV